MATVRMVFAVTVQGTSYLTFLYATGFELPLQFNYSFNVMYSSYFYVLNNPFAANRNISFYMLNILTKARRYNESFPYNNIFSK